MSYEQKPYEPINPRLRRAVESFPEQDRSTVFNGPKSPLDWVRELSEASKSRQNGLAVLSSSLADLKARIVAQYRAAENAYTVAAERIRTALEIDAANVEAYKANVENENGKASTRHAVEFFTDLRVKYQELDPADLARWEEKTAREYPRYGLGRIEQTAADAQPGAVAEYKGIPPGELASLQKLIEDFNAMAFNCRTSASMVEKSAP